MKTRMFAGAMAALALEGAAGSAALADPRDEARVRQTVLAVPTNADLRAFDAIAPLFADEVVVDYTSLWGGTAETMTPEVLMTAWAGVLPGFDATWHEIGRIEVRIAGDRAQATMPVDARHWLGDGFWRVVGRYDYDLVRRDRGWTITRMVLTVTSEDGDRGLVGDAKARAGR
jgi:hypothetical protein